jgi:hypothetical protein
LVVYVWWRNGSDEVSVVLVPSRTLSTTRTRVVSKSAIIQGHKFSDPPDERHWWDRWRARLGW